MIHFTELLKKSNGLFQFIKENSCSVIRQFCVLVPVTVSRLKEQLKKHGLSTTGNKATLVERLEEHFADNPEAEEEADDEEDSSEEEETKPSKKTKSRRASSRKVRQKIKNVNQSGRHMPIKRCTCCR